MKNVLTLVLIVLVFSACNNNEKKARKLIKEYLKTSMNDFSSYEPVEFSTLDSTYSSYEESEESHRLKEEIKNTRLAVFDISVDYFDYKKKIDSLIGVDSLLSKSFIPDHNGYAMSHKFRGKNAFSAIMLKEYGYYFDKDLTKVTDVIDFNDAFEKFNESLERINK
jgi:hypothetical protein